MTTPANAWIEDGQAGRDRPGAPPDHDYVTALSEAESIIRFERIQHTAEIKSLKWEVSLARAQNKRFSTADNCPACGACITDNGV